MLVRCTDQQVAPRLDDAQGLGTRPLMVGNVLEHIEHGDGIERLILEVEAGRITADETNSLQAVARGVSEQRVHVEVRDPGRGIEEPRQTAATARSAPVPIV